MKIRLDHIAVFGCICTTALALALPASAQSSEETAQVSAQVSQLTKSLPANAQQVLERLSGLNELPSGQWRVHAGDIPHGENIDLDDSSWPIAPPRSHAPKEAVWYRQWITVPMSLRGYDLTGTRIWFKFRADSRGTIPQIVYFNGRRVALGDDLEPVVLFQDAKPGDRVLVAVKLLPTEGRKSVYGATMKIDFAPNRPDPNDLRDEFISTALLIPSLSKNISSDNATLEKAIDDVDVKALDENDQAKFDASLKAATSDLEALKPMLQRVTFYETGNSHIDAAWLWPKSETVEVVKHTYGTALQLMNEYPFYTFSQSAAQYNEWLADKYPQINDGIKQRIKDGRWELVGGMWVEPDLNLPSGEATARSILLGKRYYEKECGINVNIGWNPDSFGYNWQLPQIYKKSGIDYFVTQKMSWNDINQLPLKLFWWESPDGSKVLTYFPQDYSNTNMAPVRLAANMVTARKRSPGLTDMMDLYGVGDHGGGATRAMLDQAQHWLQPDKITPKYQYGTALNFFNKVKTEIAPESPTWNYFTIANGYKYPTPVANKISIPTWDSELYLEVHRGCYTTQARQKANLRHSEEWALNAEKYASLAWLDGQPYPGAQLTTDWEKVTFNDFHDLAGGSGIAVIYRDAQKDFNLVHLSTNAIDAASLRTVAAEINTRAAGQVPVLVFNPLAWARSGVFTVDVQMPTASPNGISLLDAHGRVVPTEILSRDKTTNTFHLLVRAKDVPSMGYEVLHAIPGSRPFTSDLKVSGLTLENANLRVTVDRKSGCITSLFDKKSNFETLAKGSCGNELQLFKDNPKGSDAWNIDPGTFDVPPTRLDEADSVVLVDKGPLRASIRVTHHWDKSTFVQTIQLYADSDQVNVVNDIDWQETHILLKSAFALAATSDKATYEIPYGTIQRTTLRNNSWEKAQYEVPALRWADLGNGAQGFSLINEDKYGYDAVGNLLRLTLLRSPVYPDPNADRGHQHFSYALYPHAGDWKQALTERHGYAYDYKLKAMQVNAHTGILPNEHSFVTVTPDNVLLTAMKKAEDSNGLMLHMYEWAGKSGNVEITVPKGATGATETNLMEIPQGPPLQIVNNRIAVPVHPYEIVAVRVDYPDNVKKQ